MEFVQQPTKTRQVQFTPVAERASISGGGGGSASPTNKQMNKALSITNERQGRVVDSRGNTLSFKNPRQALTAIKNDQVQAVNYIDVAYNLNLIPDKENYSPKQALAFIESAEKNAYAQDDHAAVLRQAAEDAEVSDLRKAGRGQMSLPRPDVQQLRKDLSRNKGISLIEVISHSLQPEPNSPVGFTGSGTSGDGVSGKTSEEEIVRHQVPNKGQEKPGGNNYIGEAGRDEEQENSPHQAIKRVEALKKELAEAERQAREAKLMLRIQGKNVSEEYAQKIHAILDVWDEENQKISPETAKSDNINNREASFLDSDYTEEEITYDEIEDFLEDRQLEEKDFS